LVATGAALLCVAFPLRGQVGQAPPRGMTAADTAVAIHLDTALDLADVIQRALDASPDAARAQADVRTARSEERVSVGEYLPSLAANSSMLRSNVVTEPVGVPLSPGAPNSYTAGLAASVDLFTGGRRGADRTRALADMNAAAANDVNQRFAVTLDAERAFYETLRAADLVDVAKARVTQGGQGLRYAEDRVRAGTATRSDELRAQLELTGGRQQLVAALDTLQTAAYALGRLVGANGAVGAKRPASLEPRALALGDSDVVRLAVASSPAVQTARAIEAANAAATKSARTYYVPDIKVTGGYNWANETPIVGAIRPGWALSVGTSFPLFNGFVREDAVTRADAATEVAHVAALDATRQARAEAARLLGALNFAQQNIALAEEAVGSADEDLRVQSERYRAGISTELDQLTSQLALTQARLGLVAARFNYQVARAELEALVGRGL
jgi:outer membrane protein TolC